MAILSMQMRRCSVSLRRSGLRRLFTSRAELVTIDPQGIPTSRHVELGPNDLLDAGIMLPKDVGDAFYASILLNGGISAGTAQGLCPLLFHHATRHFAHVSCLYPQVVLHHDLKRQSSQDDTSPATLFLAGATHVIALDGSPAEIFFKHANDSFRTWTGALNLLKDR